MANLLMIDDNPQSQKYLGRIIRHRTSHALVFAGDGPEGIEKIVEQRPDLLFLDLFLPGTDGFELFTTLRNHPATHNVPIIIHAAVPLDDVTQIRLRRITQSNSRLRHPNSFALSTPPSNAIPAKLISGSHPALSLFRLISLGNRVGMQTGDAHSHQI